MALAVETHPQREQIVQALINGETPKKIAKWVNPRLSHVAIYNYRNAKFQPAMNAAVTAATVASAYSTAKLQEIADNPTRTNQALTELTQTALTADPIRARLAQHQATVDATLERTVSGEKPDPRGVAALIAADLKSLELDCRLTGRLDTRPTTGDVNLAVLVGIPRGSATDDKPEIRQLAPGDVSFSDPE